MNAKGFTTLTVDGEEYRIRIGFSEMADADEYLGRSILSAMSMDPQNFHLIRVLFYFATREHSKLKGVKEAGRVLANSDMGEAQEQMWEAMKASGVIKVDDSGEA